ALPDADGGDAGGDALACPPGDAAVRAGRVSHHLRLLSYNIRHGGTGREAALAAVIRAAAPDVVLLQEATRPDVVAYLAAEAGFAHWGTTRRQSLGYLSRDEIRHAQWHRPRW